MEISKLINEPESATLEFSSELPALEELAKIVCGFSNASGGLLVIGMDPKTKQVIGLHDSRIFELQETLRKIVYDLVEPIPSVFDKIYTINQKKLYALNILPGNLKPYNLKGFDKFSGTYIRMGDSIQKATPQIIAELDRIAANVNYDSTPVYDSTVEDLDNSLIEEYLSKREILFGIPKALINYALLERNHLITRESGKIYPTTAGILCFSKRINDFFPKAKIKCKIFEHEDKSKLLDIKMVSGPIFKQIDTVLDFFKNCEIPKEVLKELLINSIVHRDYAISQDIISVSLFKDRIEVISPGYLPIGITNEELRQGVCVRRNMLIYRYFYDMGLGNKSETGLQKVNRILNENNFPNVYFSSHHNNLIARISFESCEEFLSKEEEKILKYLSINEFITNVQCQKLLRIKAKQAQYLLTKLTKKNKLTSIGEKKGRKYILAN